MLLTAKAVSFLPQGNLLVHTERGMDMMDFRQMQRSIKKTSHVIMSCFTIALELQGTAWWGRQVAGHPLKLTCELVNANRQAQLPEAQTISDLVSSCLPPVFGALFKCRQSVIGLRDGA